MSELDDLRAENERLQQWVHDCQAGMYINCVYCGHRYGPDNEVPATMADVLKEHIEQCPEHPMSLLKEKHGRLEARAGELADFVSKVTETLPRGHVLATEARDVLRDGLYGGTVGDLELPEGWKWWEGGSPEKEDEDRRVLCAVSEEGFTVEVWHDGDDYLHTDGASFGAVEAVIGRRRAAVRGRLHSVRQGG